MSFRIGIYGVGRGDRPLEIISIVTTGPAEVWRRKGAKQWIRGLVEARGYHVHTINAVANEKSCCDASVVAEPGPQNVPALSKKTTATVGGKPIGKPGKPTMAAIRRKTKAGRG